MKITSLSVLVALLSFSSVSEADYTLTCESQSGRYTICRTNTGRDARVSLERRLSKASCQRGYSWGVVNGGVWVDRGCRARFRISEYRRDDYYNDNYGGRHDSGGYYDYDREERIRQRQERERLRLERQKLELERERKRLQAEKRELQIQQRLSCPAGARPGRCSTNERKRGCKDWKEGGTLPCKSGG